MVHREEQPQRGLVTAQDSHVHGATAPQRALRFRCHFLRERFGRRVFPLRLRVHLVARVAVAQPDVHRPEPEPHLPRPRPGRLRPFQVALQRVEVPFADLPHHELEVDVAHRPRVPGRDRRARPRVGIARNARHHCRRAERRDDEREAPAERAHYFFPRSHISVLSVESALRSSVSRSNRCAMDFCIAGMSSTRRASSPVLGKPYV